MNSTSPNKSYKSISIWLGIGCLMVLVQVILGGITRLTDSGLSITEWKVITGTIPPLNDAEWIATFEKYKIAAKQQYESIHRNMTLSEFKSIFFWEYFHRLWARMMGFVFAIPFFYFLIKKMLSKKLIKQLMIVIFLASLSAIFGWFMVSSGLNNDKRTWVNAYNLLIHLLLATGLYSYLLYVYFDYSHSEKKSFYASGQFNLIIALGILIPIQIALGALVSGMKAALVFPYPWVLLKLDIVSQIFNSSQEINIGSWIDYEPNPKIKLIVQIIHRTFAGIIFGISAYLLKKEWFSPISKYIKILIGIILLQIILGWTTAAFSTFNIPVFWGAIHQFTAFILLSSYLWIFFQVRR